MIQIETRPAPRQDAPHFARKTMVQLRLLGAVAMLLMGYTNYEGGLSTRFDLIMLGTLLVTTLGGALLITLNPRHMRKAAIVNASLFLIYLEAILFRAVVHTSSGGVNTFGSVTQFIPALYVALYVLLDKRAVLLSWLIYATIAVQCVYGLWLGQAAQTPAVQQQMYWAVLASHPCCILALSFMTHLRGLVDKTQHEAIQAKERFLAMVSHEVRSPLQTIVSSLDVFEVAPTGPAAQRAVARVRSAAAVLETQIRDLTAFTRLELSPDLHVDQVNLKTLLPEIEQVYREWALARGLALRVQAPSQDLLVQADGDRLRQVLDNLVSNAIKYTPHGSVTLGVEPQADGMTHLWVQDTGRGIPTHRIAQVFEPFVRIKANPQERIEGTGLGLAVVRQLVGLMQGQLEVDSTEGQGTTVHVRLPLPILKSSSPPTSTATRPQSALVVDDDIDILQAMAELLKAWGVEDVLTASDASTAARILSSRSVDVALIDLQLAASSGYEIARVARASQLNARTPLIAMSANALDQQTIGATAFCDYLPKPVARAALIQSVIKALS
jgi:signal transduction histidine kinase/CheY-like chemotaxis protein